MYRAGQAVSNHFTLHNISLKEHTVVVIILLIESLWHHQTGPQEIENILF